MAYFVLKGNTYEHKERLKEIGAFYRAIDKAWIVDHLAYKRLPVKYKKGIKIEACTKEINRK